MAEPQDLPPGEDSGQERPAGPARTHPHPPAPDPSRVAAWRVLLPVALLGAGLLFGTSASLADRDPGDAREATGLEDLVRDRSEEVDALSRRVGDLEAEVEALRGTAGAEDAATAELLAQGDDVAAAAGTAEISGDALTVTLDDAGYSLDTLPEGFTVDDVVVHQQDVQGVVNALWAGGAEGIMLQDQRLISSSAIRCVGNTLYLQGRVYSPPYTITAVGDVEAMRAALEGDPTVALYRSYVEEVGLGYEVQGLGQQTLPGFTGSTGGREARGG